jgi:hypothetical protein
MTSLSTNLGWRGRLAATALAAIASLGLLGLPGCHKGNDTAQPAAKEEAAKEGPAAPAGECVTLTAEQVTKLGIATEPAKAADYTAEIVGYGVVVPHEAIAAAVAELTTAQAAQAQSRAAAARAQRLTGTPGAMSADAVETSARQVATDSAALTLAERRLSSVIGAAPLDSTGAALQDLASGKAKLLRASFPLGALQGATPPSLRAAHLETNSSGASQTPGWSLHPVWNAPADASLPGRSFFGVLKGGDAGEGERLLVWAPGTGPAQRGVTIPAAALVISEGKYWCFVEQKPGSYLRREVATDRPVGDGYVVTQGIAAGDRVVTAAAGLLLAREMNPNTEAD